MFRSTYALGTVISLGGTSAEVLAVSAVDALLEGALGVGLALAFVVHSVLVITLASGALEFDIVGVALLLRSGLGLGVVLLVVL